MRQPVLFASQFVPLRMTILPTPSILSPANSRCFRTIQAMCIHTSSSSSLTKRQSLPSASLRSSIRFALFLEIRGTNPVPHETVRTFQAGFAPICSHFHISLHAKSPARLKPSRTLAGAEGLEPSTKVLETHVLPLHHTPKHLFSITWARGFVNRFYGLCPGKSRETCARRAAQRCVLRRPSAGD